MLVYLDVYFDTQPLSGQSCNILGQRVKIIYVGSGDVTAVSKKMIIHVCNLVTHLNIKIYPIETVIFLVSCGHVKFTIGYTVLHVPVLTGCPFCTEK